MKSKGLTSDGAAKEARQQNLSDFLIVIKMEVSITVLESVNSAYSRWYEVIGLFPVSAMSVTAIQI